MDKIPLDKFGRPRIVDKVGIKVYYDEFGQPHRENAPAVEYANGDASWYQNGVSHREDGPAVDFPSVGRFEWYLHGERFLSMNDWARVVGIFDTDEFTMLKLKYHG